MQVKNLFMLLIFISALNTNAISSSKVIVSSIGLYAAFVSWFMYTINHCEEDLTPNQLKYSKIPELQASFERYVRICQVSGIKKDLAECIKWAKSEKDSEAEC